MPSMKCAQRAHAKSSDTVACVYTARVQTQSFCASAPTVQRVMFKVSSPAGACRRMPEAETKDRSITLLSDVTLERLSAGVKLSYKAIN